MFFTPGVSCSSASFVQCPLGRGCREGSRWAPVVHAACRGGYELSKKSPEKSNKELQNSQAGRKEVLSLQKR